MTTADDSPASVWQRAERACRAALEADTEAAAEAVTRLGGRVLTLSRSETVLEALRRAAPEMVAVAESRPGREGIGTAGRLAEADVESIAADHAQLARWIER